MAIGPYELTGQEQGAVRAADGQGGAYLLLRDGTGRLVLHPLAGHAVRIGRAPDNELVIDWDAEVSRAHARLELGGGRWSVVDDGLSRNGTYVGETRIQGRKVLASGDIVRVGRTPLVLRAAVDPLGETLTAADRGDAVQLSPAERRVLEALCQPCLADPSSPRPPASNPEIAEALVLSVAGVKTHLRALFDKFGIEDLPQNRKRAELARRAITLGIVRS